MNPKVQRYLPPLIVVGSAFYFGWPPSKPLDLGEDIVRATSVRWNAKDLADPQQIHVVTDPFREVIVPEATLASAVGPEEPETPKGPDPSIIRDGLSLDGFANTPGRRWAVINGRPQVAGDRVRTTGAESLVCEIIAVQGDRVIVRCETTNVELRPLPFGSRKSQPAPPTVPQVDAQPGPAIQQIAPPPQP